MSRPDREEAKPCGRRCSRRAPGQAGIRRRRRSALGLGSARLPSRRTLRLAAVPLVAALALFAAACPRPADPPDPNEAAADGGLRGPRSPEGGGPEAAAAQWTRDGLEAQLRMEQLRRAGQEAGYDPATTPWRAADRELPDRFSRPSAEEHGEWDTPGRLVGDLVAALGLADPLGEDAWEVTLRVMETGTAEAIAVVQEWGFKDDAIAGRDLRLVLGRASGNWYLQGMDERYHCRRGVTDEGLCI